MPGFLTRVCHLNGNHGNWHEIALRNPAAKKLRCLFGLGIVLMSNDGLSELDM